MYTVLIEGQKIWHQLSSSAQDSCRPENPMPPLGQPIHQSPAHAPSHSVGLPVSEQLSKEALSLPCSVGLSEDAQKEVINQLRLR
jgi:dTDP-4-amino-4,6-dideoxygalactose transaminase